MKIITVIVIAVIFLLIAIEFVLGFYFLAIILLLSAGVARFLRLTHRYKHILYLSKIGLIVGLVDIVCFIMIYRYELNQTKDNADLIIHKLYEYKNENGFYPNDLKALTPKYLDKIPKCKIGLINKDFFYKLDRYKSYDKELSNFIDTSAVIYFLGYNTFSGKENTFNVIDKYWTTKEK